MDLIEAIETGNLDQVKKNLPIEQRLRTDMLGFAVNVGNFDIVKCLVENGCDPRIREDYAFVLAILAGHFKIAKYLIKKGCRPDSRDNYALMLCAEKGYLDFMKFLVKKGANPRALNDAALVRAADMDHLEIITFLIEKGCDPQKIISNQHQSFPVVKYLFDNGYGHKFNHNDLLWNVVEKGQVEILNYLLKIGLEPEDPGLIKSASREGYLEIVQIFLGLGFHSMKYDHSTLLYAHNSKIQIQLFFSLINKEKYAFLSKINACRSTEKILNQKLCSKKCFMKHQKEFLKKILKPTSMSMLLAYL
jgi:hypothetical protein